jgi:hypothetical protein
VVNRHPQTASPVMMYVLAALAVLAVAVLMVFVIRAHRTTTTFPLSWVMTYVAIGLIIVYLAIAVIITAIF